LLVDDHQVHIRFVLVAERVLRTVE